MLRRKTARSLAVLLALALLSLCACGEGGSIRLVETTPEPTAPPPTLEPLPERPEDLSVRVYCDGLLTDRGYYRNETVYLDPALLSGELGLPLENSADEDRFRVIIGDLTVTGDAGTGYFLAGERYLFAPHGWLTVDGRAFLPADALSKLFGVEIVCAEDPLRAEFSTAGAALMKSVWLMKQTLSSLTSRNRGCSFTKRRVFPYSLLFSAADTVPPQRNARSWAP